MRNDAHQDGDDGDGLARRAARAGGATWRRLGPYGRLALGAVLAWPAADLAREMGLLPHWHLVSLACGAILSALSGCALAALKARGRRRWRAQGGVALAGGWRERALLNAEAIAAGAARLEAVEAKLRDLFEMMAEATEAAGLPGIDTVQLPSLRLVRDGEAG